MRTTLHALGSILYLYNNALGGMKAKHGSSLRVSALLRCLCETCACGWHGFPGCHAAVHHFPVTYMATSPVGNAKFLGKYCPLDPVLDFWFVRLLRQK